MRQRASAGSEEREAAEGGGLRGCCEAALRDLTHPLGQLRHNLLRLFEARVEKYPEAPVLQLTAIITLLFRLPGHHHSSR